MFTKKTDISAHGEKSKHHRERGFVSFAEEVESKMICDYKEQGQCNGFADSLEHNGHSKEFLQESATAKKIKNVIPSAPFLSEKEQSLKSAEKSDSSSFDNDKTSNSKETSTVNVDTPSQDGNWGMSPIAPSASPHNADFLFSSSTGDTSLISGNSVGNSAGVVESPFETELNVLPTMGLTTPHGQPSSLTPILRTSVPRQSTSSSKKLSVSFSSKDESFDGGKASGKFLSTTPLSEVSHKTGLKNQVQKRQRAATKKQVLMKTAPASSASSKVTASSNSSGSSRRTRSSASRSPLEVEENNLTVGAFTQERLEVLQLLSSQAAIAITNAKLYAEIKAKQRQLAQFLEAMPVGVFVLDADSQPYYANQTAQEILGKEIVRRPSVRMRTKRLLSNYARKHNTFLNSCLATSRDNAADHILW